MDQREQLTRHLTPHGVPLELGIRSTDIAEIMSGMDLAFLLGLVGKRNAAILMAHYCDDKWAVHDCYAFMIEDALYLSKKQGWNLPRPKMIDGLAHGSVHEHLGVLTRCPVCNGTRAREINKLVVVCPGCEGAGFLPYDSETWQAIIGCDEVSYVRHWTSRIDWARRRLQWWELDAAMALRERMGT